MIFREIYFDWKLRQRPIFGSFLLFNNLIPRKFYGKIQKPFLHRAGKSNKTQEPKGLEGFELESLRVSQDFVKDSG